jgi:hypothetical protein
MRDVRDEILIRTRVSQKGKTHAASKKENKKYLLQEKERTGAIFINFFSNFDESQKFFYRCISFSLCTGNNFDSKSQVRK